MKKENDKKITEKDLENVSGGYKRQIDFNGSPDKYSKYTTLILHEALRLLNEGDYGNNIDAEEKLKEYGFNRENNEIRNSILGHA